MKVWVSIPFSHLNLAVLLPYTSLEVDSPHSSSLLFPFLLFFFFYPPNFSLFFSIFWLFVCWLVWPTTRPKTKQYRQALNKPIPLHLQQKQRSFLTFGFGASGSSGSDRGSAASVAISGGGGVPPRRESNINVNVTPTSHDAISDTPEIRKYKKRFNSEVLCASLWGNVNLTLTLTYRNLVLEFWQSLLWKSSIFC